jgi:hypothetical protein
MGERLVVVYRAFSEGEAYIIKGKLEENGIPCILKSNAAPSVYVFTMDGMGEIKICVPESMAEAARRLVEEVAPSADGGGDAAEG